MSEVPLYGMTARPRRRERGASWGPLYPSQSFYTVVLHKSIPARIRQLRANIKNELTDLRGN